MSAASFLCLIFNNLFIVVSDLCHRMKKLNGSGILAI